MQCNTTSEAQYFQQNETFLGLSTHKWIISLFLNIVVWISTIETNPLLWEDLGNWMKFECAIYQYTMRSVAIIIEYGCIWCKIVFDLCKYITYNFFYYFVYITNSSSRPDYPYYMQQVIVAIATATITW